MRLPTRIILLVFALGLLAAVACAGDVATGFVSYDFIGGGLAEFDISNQTGPNSSIYPDETFPVSNSISLGSLSLTVYYAGGGSFTYGSGYFSLEPDGLSWAGPQVPDSSLFSSATLTGTFNPTLFDLNDGSHFNADPNFTATISDPNNLQDGDFAIIYATPAVGTTPEPGTLLLLGTGAFGLLRFRRRKLLLNLRNRFGNRTAIAFLLCCLLLPAAYPAFASSVVRLNQWTLPSQGYAGETQVNISGSGFPSGDIHPWNVKVSIWPTTCMVGTPTTTAALKFTRLIGSLAKVQFLIPASLAANTYPVSISDTVDGITSSNCSMMTVLVHSSIASCVPDESMSALIQGQTVYAYIPNGNWGGGNTGIQMAQIEPSGGSFISIATPNVTNSCASNSVTGETICVANNTDIYRITGAALNTIVTSFATTAAGFSGGDCYNCGVAIDQVNNLAYIQIGLTGSPSGSGIESFNLGTGAQTAFPTFNEPSEDILIDPGRHWVLSPNESNIYDLIDVTSFPWKEYAFPIPGLSGQMDSAAEDCTTGIALASQEASFPEPSLLIVDPTQGTFVAGNPGSWSAPEQSVAFPEFIPTNHGTDGLAVAPGSHLALVTGEFGGNLVGVVTLPSTSGSGTPAFGDYVAALLPNTPDGNAFSIGDDPHTVTAYHSPAGGFFGMAADWSLGYPNYVAVIDMPGLLSAPRCNPAPGHQCVNGPHEVDPMYDLVAHGIVRYVQVH